MAPSFLGFWVVYRISPAARQEVDTVPGVLERLRLHLHAPLLWALRACSFTAVAERDALRARDLNQHDRSVRVLAATPRERRRKILEALLTPEVRSVFYYRLAHGALRDQLMGIVLRRLFAPQAGVEIRCSDLGPGFVLGHGMGAVVWAERIGADCTVFQQATLGLVDGTLGSLPVLDDRVWVWPGARVLGVRLHDDATVGANAVVLDDVPAGCTAVGVPARIIQPR